MRTFVIESLLVLLTSPLFAGVTERADLNPLGTRGLVPLESEELGLVTVEGGIAAAFTGLREKKAAIYVRRYDEKGGGWGEAVRLSDASEDSAGRPSLYRAPDGLLHCVWLSRVGRRKYDVLYSSQERDSWNWTPPTRFPGGSKKTSPYLAGDGQGTLFLYYEIVDDANRWGRLSFRASVDGGKTWEESNPNFPAATKKGGASNPQLTVRESGELWLVWLDQTPGGKSVVFNVSKDRGKTWRESPGVVNEDRRFALSNPAIVAASERVHIIWTVTLLGKSGKATEFWTDTSDDGGESWNGNQVFHSGAVSDVTLRAYRVNQDVGCVWIDRSPDSGRIVSDVIWRGAQAVDEEPSVLLADERGSYFEYVWLVEGPDNPIVFYSNRTMMDGGRVGVLHRPSPDAGWVDSQVNREKPATRAMAPIAVLDPDTRVYNVLFHEKGRIQFLGAPEIWDTSIMFSQLELDEPFRR